MTHSSPTRRSSDLDILAIRLLARQGLQDDIGVQGIAGKAAPDFQDCSFIDSESVFVYGKAFAAFVVEDYFYQVIPRSEEHTSELQSLMRNPYAVFCLKKKNKE